MSVKRRTPVDERKPSPWFALKDFVMVMQQNVQAAHDQIETEAEGAFLQVANLELEIPVVMHVPDEDAAGGESNLLVRTHVVPPRADGGAGAGVADTAVDAAPPKPEQTGRIKVSFKPSIGAFKS